MHVPWEIKVSLRRGTVYYMEDRNLTSSEPHYFVVVNKDPLGDEVLLLTVASSKIETVRHRRQREPLSTLVEIRADDYQDFTVDSIIDCNSVITKSLAELCEQMGKKKIQPKGDIPPDILAKLTRGVLESRMVTAADKAKIRD